MSNITADQAANNLIAAGYKARAWYGDNRQRVYVTRELSRGRRQEMGYLERVEDGEWHTKGMRRQAAAVAHVALSRGA